MSEFKPGTVAVATVCGVPNLRVFRYDHGFELRWQTTGFTTHNDADVTDVRPLVVLDLAEQPFPASGVDKFIENLRSGSIAREWVADQIEAQTKPPKPTEPLGLGAVVEDAEGRRWVRSRLTELQGLLGVVWENSQTLSHNHWNNIDAVRVVHEGVSA